MSDIYEIYEGELKFGFGGEKRVLKNGKAVNEFGLLKDIKKLQAENAELKKLTVKALGEVGLELEEDTRIGKKVMPFVRAIVLSKIQEFK